MKTIVKLIALALIVYAAWLAIKMPAWTSLMTSAISSHTFPIIVLAAAAVILTLASE